LDQNQDKDMKEENIRVQQAYNQEETFSICALYLENEMMEKK